MCGTSWAGRGHPPGWGVRPPPPQFKVCVMQPLCGPTSMPSRGEGPQSEGMQRWWWRRRRLAPRTPKGKAPTPSPKPSKVAKVPLPPPAFDVAALAATLATHTTDACQTLVEQAAVRGLDAALARGRPTRGPPC